MYYRKLVNKNVIILKDFVFLISSLIVSCVILYFFVAPLYRTYKINLLEIDIKTKNVEARKILLSSIIDSRENNENETYLKNIEKIKNLVYARNNYEGFLAKIIDISQRRGILVENFSISTAGVGNKDFYSKNVSFSASGGYTNLLNFLEDLEKSIPLIHVDSLDLRKGNDNDDGEQSKILNISVKTKFYYFDNEKK